MSSGCSQDLVNFFQCFCLVRKILWCGKMLLCNQMLAVRNNIFKRMQIDVQVHCHVVQQLQQRL